VIGCNDAGKGWWSSGNMYIYTNVVQKFVGPHTSDAHRTSHIRTVKEIGRPYSGNYPAGIANKKKKTPDYPYVIHCTKIRKEQHLP
jgi:hypothetical protein